MLLEAALESTNLHAVLRCSTKRELVVLLDFRERQAARINRHLVQSAYQEALKIAAAEPQRGNSRSRNDVVRPIQRGWTGWSALQHAVPIEEDAGVVARWLVHRHDFDPLAGATGSWKYAPAPNLPSGFQMYADTRFGRLESFL